MVSLRDLKVQIENANALGRQNLSDKGVVVAETATTYEIMNAIAEVSGGGGTEYSSIVYNEDDTITLTDKDGIDHTMVCTYDDAGKLVAVNYDGKSVELTYEGDKLDGIGGVDVTFEMGTREEISLNTAGVWINGYCGAKLHNGLCIYGFARNSSTDSNGKVFGIAKSNEATKAEYAYFDSYVETFTYNGETWYARAMHNSYSHSLSAWESNTVKYYDAGVFDENTYVKILDYYFVSNIDHQNGFALGMASGGVVEVDNAKEEQEKTVDITENGTTEVVPDEGKVLSKVTVKVDVSGGGEYIEYPLPQDDYVYYRYPPCNEERYIRIGTSSIEYGSLNADGYTKTGTMEGIADGQIKDSVSQINAYKFTIPAHKEDFVIKLSELSRYGRSSADCTEVYIGNIKNLRGGNRAGGYECSSFTINGLKKLTINTSIDTQPYTLFTSLPLQTIILKNVDSTGASYSMFENCIFLKKLQFEELIINNPYNILKNCASLETINCSKIVPSNRIDNMFFGCQSLEVLDLSSWAAKSLNFTNVNGLFRYCYSLKTINLSGWNLSHLTAIYDWFQGTPQLENVILDNTILFSASFGVNDCPNLTVESLSAIFNALPELPEGITKTLTFNTNHKILQSQVDSANAKGWTVAGGTVVSEEEYYG